MIMPISALLILIALVVTILAMVNRAPLAVAVLLLVLERLTTIAALAGR